MIRAALGASAYVAMLVSAAHAQTQPTLDECSKDRLDAEMAAKCEALTKQLLAVRENLRKLELEPASSLATAVPDAGIDGSVKLTNEAGKGEYLLMSATAVNATAKRVAERISKLDQDSTMNEPGSDSPTKDRRVVLVGSAMQPAALQWTPFETRMTDFKVRLSNDSMLGALDDLDAKGQELINKYNVSTSVVVEVAPLAAIGLAGGAIKAASAIAKFFQSQYEFVGSSAAGDDEKLLAAVACELQAQNMTVYAPGTALNIGSTKTVQKMLADADKVGGQLSTKRKKLEGTQSRLAKSGANDKADVKEFIGNSDQALKSAKAIQDEFAAYVGLITTADAGKVPLVVTIIRDHALETAVPTDETVVVRLKYFNEVGSAYTKKNLWTIFGGAPFHVSGGAVVGYLASRAGSGEVLASGLIPSHSGFVKAGRIKDRIEDTKDPVCGL